MPAQVAQFEAAAAASQAQVQQLQAQVHILQVSVSFCLHYKLCSMAAHIYSEGPTYCPRQRGSEAATNSSLYHESIDGVEVVAVVGDSGSYIAVSLCCTASNIQHRRFNVNSYVHT